MRLRIFTLVLVFSCCALGPPLRAQQIPGIIYASASTCSVQSNTAGACVILPLSNTSGQAAIALNGTFSATVQFEASADNQTTWDPLTCYNLNGGASGTSATSASRWRCNVGSLSHVRVRASAYTSGTVYATITATPTAANSISSSATSFTAANDLSGTNTSQEVIGLHNVPFCAGFTPTSGQAVTYTTASSPNPCYTAVTSAGTGISTLTSDVSASGTGSVAATVKGINSVPLCTGFTPTNGQVLNYTTGSSPNPCYTAGGAAQASSYSTSGPGSGALNLGAGNGTEATAATGSTGFGAPASVPTPFLDILSSAVPPLGTSLLVLNGTADGNGNYQTSYTTIPFGGALVPVNGSYAGTANSAGALDVCSVGRAGAAANQGDRIYMNYAPGDYACGSHLIPATQLSDSTSFQGEIWFAPGMVLHQYAADSTVVVPGHVNLIGIGQGASSPTSANSPGAVIFQACVAGDTHSYCNGTGGSPSTGFLASTENAALASGTVSTGTATIAYEAASVTAFSGTSGTLTFTATNNFTAAQVVNLTAFSGGNTGLNGQQITILAAGLSGSQFEAAVTGSGYASGTGTATQAAIFYQSQNITIAGASISGCNGTFQLLTGTTFSVGSSGCTTWTGGTATGPPTQLAFGRAAAGITNAAEFESHLAGLHFDGHDDPNVISVADGYCQEDCGIYGAPVLITNFAAGLSSSASSTGGGGMGISLFTGTGTGSANSTWMVMNIGNAITDCKAGAIPVQLLGVAPKVFSDVSIVNTNCSTFPNYDVVQGGSGAFVFHGENWHLESYGIYGLYIGGTGATTNGVHVNDINSCCNGSASNSATVGIASGGIVSNVLVEDIKAESPNAPPNTLVDLQNSNTITRASHQAVNLYMLGDSGGVIFDSTGTAVSAFPGGISATTETLTGLLTLPVGTVSAPSAQAAGSASNTGVLALTTAFCWDAAASVVDCSVAGGHEIADNKAFAVSQTNSANGTAGATMGVTGTGTTESWNPSTVLLLPQCKITSAVVLASGSATSICTWPLPNSAQTWAWHCHGNYTITGGTLPTLILGMNAAQAPTSETGNAMIWSASSVQTFGSATSTAAGNVAILTGVTNTTTAAPWESWGTIQASATAGNFSIQGQLGGTATPAGTILVGSTCEIY